MNEDQTWSPENTSLSHKDKFHHKVKRRGNESRGQGSKRLYKKKKVKRKLTYVARKQDCLSET